MYFLFHAQRFRIRSGVTWACLLATAFLRVSRSGLTISLGFAARYASRRHLCHTTNAFNLFPPAIQPCTMKKRMDPTSTTEMKSLMTDMEYGETGLEQDEIFPLGEPKIKKRPPVVGRFTVTATTMFAMLGLLLFTGNHHRRTMTYEEAGDNLKMTLDQPAVSDGLNDSTALSWEEVLATTPSRCANEGSGCLVYALENSGMGSAVISAFMTKVYFQKFKGRDFFVADESRYPYYRSEDGSTGVFNTFFTPQFPVIDDKEQYKYIDPVVPKGQSMEGLTHYTINGKTKKRSPWRDTYTDKSPIILARRPDYRGNMYNDLRSMDEEELWFLMWEDMCPSLRYNDETQAKVDEIKASHALPNLLELDKPSVAFHLRRSDKVEQGETTLMAGKLYVEKLLEVAPGVEFGSCYIASDDEAAVAEVEQALDDAGIQCDHVSLLEGDKKGGKQGKITRSSYEASLIFLTELSMMVEATYYIGSWDSNVAILATILRGCPQYGHEMRDFAHSYHVNKNGFLKDGNVGV